MPLPTTFNTGLNRVTLAELPGLPDGIAGRLAHERLASWSLGPQIAARCPDLEMSPIPDGPDAARLTACAAYLPALDRLLAAGDTRAAALADELGTALAALVATLRLAPADARAARPEWPDTHWARWQAARRVTLGGGVLSGALGQRMHRAAVSWLPRLGVPDVTLTLAPQPRLLMLRGVARLFRNGEVITLDAGHTALKRAVATLRDGEVVALTPAPLLPIPQAVRTPDGMLHALVDALLDGSPAGITQFGVSLSLQLDDEGNAVPGASHGSAYSPLAAFPLRQTLAEHLSARAGQPVQVELRHEGQAAVNGLPGADAAILLGTSVGGAVRA